MVVHITNWQITGQLQLSSLFCSLIAHPHSVRLMTARVISQLYYRDKGKTWPSICIPYMVMLSNEIVSLCLNYAKYILSKGVLYETAWVIFIPSFTFKLIRLLFHIFKADVQMQTRKQFYSSQMEDPIPFLRPKQRPKN